MRATPLITARTTRGGWCRRSCGSKGRQRPAFDASGSRSTPFRPYNGSSGSRTLTGHWATVAAVDTAIGSERGRDYTRWRASTPRLWTGRCGTFIVGALRWWRSTSPVVLTHLDTTGGRMALSTAGSGRGFAIFRAHKRGNTPSSSFSGGLEGCTAG